MLCKYSKRGRLQMIVMRKVKCAASVFNVKILD